MACGNSRHKTCRDKSCQRFYNNTSMQALPVNTDLQLIIEGSKVVDTGVSIETQNMSYTTLKTGLYHIAGDVTVEATAAGDVIFEVFMDGVPLPCTKRSRTVSIGYNPIHTETDIYLDGCCCDVTHTFTYRVVSDANATGRIIEFCSGILKLA